MEGVYVPCSGGFLFLLFVLYHMTMTLGANSIGGNLVQPCLIRFGLVFYRAYIVYRNLSASYGNSSCIAMT